MSRYIDADECVTVRLYDNEREEEYTERMTIAESLDHFTDEGCPPTIDAVSVVHGEWIESEYQNDADVANGNYAYICSNCHHTDIHAKTQSVPYCWYCGAKMDGERKESE